MVEIQIVYQGKLRCSAKHVESGTLLITDAPKDNMGNGESFSPTDLVATALGTCMLTTMGIVAQRMDIDLSNAKVNVIKEMASAPTRRIARLTVAFHIPLSLDADVGKRLENAAMTCPVHKSLGSDVEIPVSFNWN